MNAPDAPARLEAVRADPAGNLTLLVTTPTAAASRPALARALLARTDCQQVGFLTEPRLGGLARLEMMGGEFCGNALRCLGALAAAERGLPPGEPVAVEISGCDSPLTVWPAPPGGYVRGEIPLPLLLEVWRGMPTAVFAGIVHALCRREVNDRRVRTLARSLAGHYRAPAAGILLLTPGTLQLRPAVYVRDTDTLYFESSCASGSAAAAAILSAESRDSAAYCLAQPGGILIAAAEWDDVGLHRLTVEGPVTLGERETYEL